MEIPLPNVKMHVLKKSVDFMAYHFDKPIVEIEKPLKSSNMEEIVSRWDAAFVEVDQDVIFELILVKNRRKKKTPFFFFFVLLRLPTTWILSRCWIWPVQKWRAWSKVKCRFMFFICIEFFLGRTPEQIRQTFHIENDFTPAEEEALRAENSWAENDQ